MPPFPLSTAIGPGFRDQPGYRHTKPLPNPAAGADVLYVVPGGEVHHVLGVRILFTTSVAVANRFVILRILDGGGTVVLESIAFSAQAASLAVAYNFSPVYASGTPVISGVQQVALPDLYLEPGWTIDIGAHGMDAADQISGFTAFAEVYPVGVGGVPPSTT